MTISKRAKRTTIIIAILILFCTLGIMFITKANKNINITEDTELYMIFKYEKGKFKSGFLDKNGAVVIEPKYEFATDFFEGVAYVKNNNTGYLIDKNENKLCKVKGDYIGFSEGLWLMQINDKYKYIDKNGDIIIESKFDACFNFSEDLARVKSNEKWGYIDKNGDLVIEPKFDFCWDFTEELAAVKLENKWGYIDKKGDWVIEPKFDYFTDTDMRFSEGLAVQGKNGNWGYINKEGNWVIDPIFQGPTQFKNGYAKVFKNDKEGIINKKGEFIAEAKYDEICHIYLDNAGIKFRQNNLFGVLNLAGEVVIKPTYEGQVPSASNIVLKNKDTVYFFDKNLEIKNMYKIGEGRMIQLSNNNKFTGVMTKEGQFFFNEDGELVLKYDDVSEFFEKSNKTLK